MPDVICSSYGYLQKNMIIGQQNIKCLFSSKMNFVRKCGFYIYLWKLQLNNSNNIVPSVYAIIGVTMGI